MVYLVHPLRGRCLHSDCLVQFGGGGKSSLVICLSFHPLPSFNKMSVLNRGRKIDRLSGAFLDLRQVTTAQRDALIPANGMLIYNTTTTSIQGYENGAWADVAAGEVTTHAALTTGVHGVTGTIIDSNNLSVDCGSASESNNTSINIDLETVIDLGVA